jgi:hypothetical protein
MNGSGTEHCDRLKLQVDLIVARLVFHLRMNPVGIFLDRMG